MLCERSGVVNIGIEGVMLATAFIGWVVGVALVPVLGGRRRRYSALTPALLAGLVAALVGGMLISFVLAWLCHQRTGGPDHQRHHHQHRRGRPHGLPDLAAVQVIPGRAGNFTPYRPPTELTDLPVVGWVFAMFLQQGPITMSVIVIVVVMQVLLFRSRWGLRTRAVGEHPKAAETVGIDVIALRYRNVVLSGLLAGLAGASLTMEATTPSRTA